MNSASGCSPWRLSTVGCCCGRTLRLRASRTLPAGALHFHKPPVFIGHFKHVARLQIHKAGHEHLWNLADARVVDIDVVVEKLAPVGDTLFEFSDTVLQLEKVFIGPELRIVLRYRE